MQRDDLVYVGHMLDMSPKATEKVQGLGRPDYDEDENLRLALAHLVQMIGEAARRVSTAVRTAHPEIPWADIVGMRSKIVHDYMNVEVKRRRKRDKERRRVDAGLPTRRSLK